MPHYLDFYKLTIPVLEAEMNRIIQESIHPEAILLKDIFLYHLGLDRDSDARGKRVRPILLLLITHANGKDWRKAIPAAAAVEFLHNFSLIHDDIEDRSELRHGRLTVWSKWGDAQAINAGDGMYTLVFQAIHKLNGYNSPEIIQMANDLVTQACLRLVEGQIMDVAFEKQEGISAVDYYRMIDGKTAALIACCAQLGGLLAEVDQSKLQLLNDLGYKLGRGFQIQDDLLGIWGNPHQTGKSVESDLINHKHTLPVIYGFQMSPKFRDRWQRGNIRPDETSQIAGWLREDGVYARVQNEIDQIETDTDKIVYGLGFSSKEGQQMIVELINGLRLRNK
jgi:geranylgeranyl diphosphate synthase, type I